MFDGSTDVIKLGSWDFNVIQLKDIEIFDLFIKQTQCPTNLWSSNFAYMWAMSQSNKRKLLWKMINGLLVTFVYSFKNSLYVYCLPFGNANSEKLIDVILIAMKYCYDWNNHDNKKTVIKMINDNQLDFLRKSPRFDENFTRVTWVGIERHFDIKKLVSLQGKEFSSVRNRLNKFHKDNPEAKLSHYRDSDYEELINLDNRWKNTSGTKYSNILDGVYYKELVKHYKELHQQTLVMRNSGGIIGMISGGVLPSGESWGSVMKFEDNIPGLSETLIAEFAREIHRTSPETELLNAGSDLGSGGLRDYKLKFRPVLNLKRYQIFLK